MGKGYIVGAGPGDIGLITKRGFDLIGIADVILYDRLVDKNILNYAKKDCKFIYVGKSATTGGETQKWINDIFVEETKNNDVVVRLHGGDPFLFGRGSEEIDELVKNNLEYEVVPGISSSFAVPTYAGIPVTKRYISSSLHIFTARSGGGDLGLDFSLMAQIKGTIVILMGVGVIEEISKGLMEKGMDSNTIVSIIQEGTTNNQKAIKGTLSTITLLVKEKEIKAPSIIIIGGTSDYLGEYDWFSKKPLFGKNIVLTRDKDSFEKSAKVFRGLGGNLNSLPMINLQTDLDKFNEEFISEIQKSDFLSFNSPKAVTSFFEGLKHLGKDSRVLGNCKILCMGSGTVEELAKYHLIPDFIPKEYSVTSLLKELSDKFGKGHKITLLSSDIHGRDEVALSLEYSQDIKIKSIYKNLKETYEKQYMVDVLEDNSYVIFLSSSAVESFVENSKDLDISKLNFVSIGPMTSKALQKYNLPVNVEAKIYSLEGIRDAIINTISR